jgi:D-3-phosphoglycerate dehydrogenase
MNTLHIVAIGDFFLDDRTLDEVIRPALPTGITVDTVQWDTQGKELLQRYNLQCEQKGPEGVPVPQIILDRVAGADVLFTQFCPVNTTVLNAAKQLKVIAVGRSGVENINLPEATKRGVSVLNTIGRNAQAVAEYTIGLMICEMRNISRGHHALKAGTWRKKFPNDASVPELPGRCIGLIGVGQIGRLVIKKLSGFEMRCIAYDPYLPAEQAREMGVELVDLDTLMRTADFVSVHAKLTPETRHIANAARLALMKPTAYLINTARAELVDEVALVACLQQGRIAGAALDVFMHEPPAADDPVLALDNVTLSPHQAGVTVDAYRTTAKMFVENIRRLWTPGPVPRNLLNKDTAPTLDALQRRLLTP